MKVSVNDGSLDTQTTEAAVGLFFAGEKIMPATALLDELCRGMISRVIEAGDFAGKSAQALVLYNPSSQGPRRIILVGLGKKEDCNRDSLRAAAAGAARMARSLSLKSVAFSPLLPPDIFPLGPAAASAALVEGALLGTYRFGRYKTVNQEDQAEVEELIVAAGASPELMKEVTTAAAEAEKIAAAVMRVRDWVSTPGNDMTPTKLAAAAREFTAENPNLVTRVIEAQELEALGMRALLGVAAGSDEPPTLTVCEYWGGPEGEKPIVLVGKGLTFDSGGISLKPADKMEEMKSDMSGAAAVIGAIKAAADLALPINLVALAPAVENLPSGKAYKPGDILKSLSGLNIEVVNTDAEGRIVLADCLHFAKQYEPVAIIDLATLTGACVVALGNHAAGMMGNDAKLKEKIKAAAEITGEKVWELPLWEEYQEMVKSDVADYRNSTGRGAGAITAGAFLSKFVGSYPWAHLDIAGMAWVEKDKSYIPKGASGYGVRLLVQLLRDWNRNGT
jgi:leucyl aminopeptidase